MDGRSGISVDEVATVATGGLLENEEVMKRLNPAEEPVRPEGVGSTNVTAVEAVMAGSVLKRVSVTKTKLGEAMVNSW